MKRNSRNHTFSILPIRKKFRAGIFLKIVFHTLPIPTIYLAERFNTVEDCISIAHALIENCQPVRSQIELAAARPESKPLNWRSLKKESKLRTYVSNPT